jgi:hypothetical protein
MHDVLRTRLLRKLESLPEEQVYQVLDYIEFLESKYAQQVPVEASGLQSFAEKIEDQLRRRTVSPSSLREAFQLISAADKVLSNITKVGKELVGDLNGLPEDKTKKPEPSRGAREDAARTRSPAARPSAPGTDQSSGGPQGTPAS